MRVHSSRNYVLTRSEDTRRPLRVSTHQEIAELAYSFWEARGRPFGSASEDWFRAERELRERGGWS